MRYHVSNFNKELDYNFPDNIKFYDTTLRDGEQTPGVCLGPFEKLEIAKKLDELKIDQIEAGFPIVSEQEREAIRGIVKEDLNADIIVLSRAKTQDIDAALDCDVDGIITFMGTSDIHLKHKFKAGSEKAIEMALNSVEYAKDHGLYVAFSAEDATRTELDFLKDIYSKVADVGADRIHIADTVGSINPHAMNYLVSELKKTLSLDIALHCHNDFGLAVANCISGLLAGANYISTTVNGIGERAGNTSLEELIMALKLLYGLDLGFNTEVIYDLSKTVEKYTNVNISKSKPIVGKNVFRHESGIHVNAVIEEPLTYEPFDPDMVGHSRQIVLGKHSGCRAVKAKVEEFDVDVSEYELCQIVELVKKNREEGKYINNEVFKDILTKVKTSKK